MVHIVSTVKCFPSHYYDQGEIFAELKQIWGLKPRLAELLENFHKNSNVRGRYTALPMEAYKELDGFGSRNDAWMEAALDLGENTLAELFHKAGIAPGAVSLLATTTITGIAVPSLDARLMNRLPFSQHMKRLPLFGLGCMGGAAGIARLADYLAGHPAELAVLLSVELCTLTIQKQDHSIANLISGSLFGDGAAAVLMVGDEHPLASHGQPKVIDNRSVFFPNTEYIMGWDIRDSGFKIVLSSDVAEVAENRLGPEIESFLRGYGLSIPDIAHWIVHPGGPKVIQAMETGLGLREGTLQLSRESLAEVGNISSASVLIILEETLKRYQPAPGAYGFLMAMGPAFSAEFVLLQW
ncbi:MAG: type III polyketide synthase [Omnitrophica WOR_2 bacterium]